MLGSKRKAPLPGMTRRKLPRDGAVVATLDMGAAKTVCFIARLVPFTDGTLECDLIGAGHFGVSFEKKPAAMHQRQNLSLQAREMAIRSAVEAAESMAGERIAEVHICVPSQSVICRHIAVELDIASGFVTADDVCESLVEGASLATPEGTTLLQVVPVSYALDGEGVGTDPRGLSGHQLTTRLVSLVTPDNVIANLTAAVESAGLKIASFIAGPHAMAQSVLSDDERELGALVVDMGAQSMGYALYTEGRLAACGGCLPGAGYITRDMAEAFSTPLAHAERQKILHGTVHSSFGDENRFVDMIPLSDHEPRQRVSRADLTDVITPRLEEMYESLTRKLVQDRCDVGALRRLVMTGGGSQLDGVCSHAERAFSMKTRLGKPEALESMPEALSGPAFSVAVGALQLVTASYSAEAGYPETESLADYGKATGTGGITGWLRRRF